MAAIRTTHIAFMAAILAVLITAPVVFMDDMALIPAAKTQVDSWFKQNVKPAKERNNLDADLAAAEKEVRVIKVRKDGSGDFSTIDAAIKSIPSGNRKRVIVSIAAGEYNEKITIDRTKPFVTLYGESKAITNLTFGGTAAQYGTVNSATLIVESDYFMAVNLVIANSAPMPDGKRVGAQALAMRISGDKAAFYNCQFIGFQDTLCDDKGNHFFKDSFVQGTVDFIFGSGKSLYLDTELHVVGDEGFRVITAQARKSRSENSGYSFVHCSITGTGTGIYLGRAWMTAPNVVYAYSDMSNVVNPAGWSDNFHPERDSTVFYGEYKCSGPGSSHAGRVKFTKELSDTEAKRFLVLGYIQGSKWLLPPPQL